MSYQQQGGGHPRQGYPTQQAYQPPPPQHDFDSYRRQGSPTLAVFAAVLGLGVAGTLVWQNLALLDLIGDASDQLPDGWQVMIIGHFVLAGIALIGAVLVFARQIAGAFVLLTSAVLTIGAVLAAPVVAEDVGLSMVSSPADIGTVSSSTELYYSQLFEFEFDNSQATLRFAALAVAVLLLIIAVLPPVLNWLKKPRQDDYRPQQAGW
jgi:hypothetical protein